MITDWMHRLAMVGYGITFDCATPGKVIACAPGGKSFPEKWKREVREIVPPEIAIEWLE